MIVRFFTAFALLCAGGVSAIEPITIEPSDTPTPAWQAWQQHDQLQRESLFHGLKWRSIGPMVQGGRVVDVASIPGQPYGFYVAYATGGVWKTTNNGVTFQPLSDALPTTVTGAIAIDPNLPKRLWVGSGEPNASRSSYAGMGVFVSDDEGATFRHSGLSDVYRIARIVVHPKNSQHVCVAAIGQLYSDGGRRGVFCTRDGGSSWKQSLIGSGHSGAIDLVMDPKNPKILYAALWDHARSAWKFSESGEGSGIYKSTDAGDTWVRLAGGLPQGKHVGRIGLAIAASQPNVVYASVDNWEPLPASEQDFGDRPLSARRLKTMSKEEFLAQDPDEIEAFIRGNDFDTELDAKTLIALIEKDELKVQDLIDTLNDAEAALFKADIRGLEIYRSDDAGAHWLRTHDKPLTEVTFTYGYYFGQLRVAPDDANRLYILGMPLITSHDGGKTFSGMNHHEVHVDHHAWWIDKDNPQRMINGNDGGVDITYDGGKSWLKLDRQPVGQFYSINVDMAEPYNVYGGLQDNGTLKGSSRTRWERGEDWSVIGGGDGMQVAIDNRDSTVYTGYQFGYYNRSGPDGGGADSNREVRPREKLKEPALRYNWNTPVMLSTHNQDVVYYAANKLFRSFDKGKTWSAISPDLSTSRNRGNVPYATITTISESAKQFGLIWVGTDDGNVWVTSGGGNDWRNVGARLPDYWVSRVIASSHAQKRAYVSLNNYRNDDATAMLYVTDDLGNSWRSISNNLPAEAINVVREDPVNGDVLYVGTDRGVYVSLNRGSSWQAFDAGLPNVPVHDLVIHPRDREIIAGTHGRSAWIADALPVQELTAAVREKAAHVFYINEVKVDRRWRSRASQWFDESADLPKTTISYWAAADGQGTLQVLDDKKHPLKEIAIDAKRGINTLEWDLIVDQAMALAAESAASAPTVDAKPADTKLTNADVPTKEAVATDAKPADTNKGKLAKLPYAESVRLGHRLFLTPGDYTVVLAINGATSESKLKLKAPEAFKARAPSKPKLRGRDDEG
jgi:photosystem II stability/assembly factor-like uncharacterized protein